MNHGCSTESGGAKTGTPADRPLRVLVVDDDKDVAQAIVRALENLGHAAGICGHAQEALDAIATQNFNLLLLDYRMPEMTGLDLLALLREEGHKIPVIMMTGYFTTEDRVRVEQLAILAILRKPITLPMLSKALKESLPVAREES